ncbi:MAG: (d)CMP kinase [Bacteroidia bacterium]|nr:(d)CMP kinase [Bacteroidia bacterium]MCX7652142.1 (d)CMP kinase [Bacteroidia bacterium]MDW8416909.1 (d)CMP kinase [Bacteroidia bacterium]
MRPIIIAIDGYAATGKSTTARAVAELLGYIHVDSGAMYRAAAWYLWKRGIRQIEPNLSPEIMRGFDLEVERNGSEMLIRLAGKTLSDELRSPEIGTFASEISAIPWIRKFLIAEQRRMGEKGGLVMDGRDIGTVVFPHAELKVFMQANLAERVERRYQELLLRGISTTREAVMADLQMRDYRDETRPISPLIKAPDARVLDTTGLTIPEQVAIVMRWAEALIYAASPS